MSIEKIKNSVENFSSPSLLGKKPIKNRVYMGIPQDSVSFSGAGTTATKTLNEFLLELMPKTIKRMVKIHEGMGEVQNQMINAIGTGLVAPLFIKYNPLSDKDEDTRTYTAWRQPVSAVLAVGTQAAIVVPFNSLIKRFSDIGYLGQQYNATLFPSDDFLKKQIKKENPDKKFTKAEMKAALEARKKEYNKRFTDMIEQDKIVFNTTDGKTASTLEMSKADFKKLFEETLDDIIEAEGKEKLQAVQNKLPKKIERGIFFHNNPDESIATLQKLQSKLNQLYNQTNLTSGSSDITNANKLFDQECKRLIKELKKEAKKDTHKKDLNEGLIKIIKEVRNKNTGSDSASLRVLDEKISKMIHSVDTMRSKKTTKEIIEYVTEVVYRRTDAIDGTIETLTKIRNKLSTSGITVKEAQTIIDDAIRDSYAAVRAKLQASGHSTEDDMKKAADWVESVGTRLSEKAKSIAKCIAEQQKKHVKSNVDGMKRWTGLGVSLAILPVTCWLLNKIYPWFMDRAFPDLSNKAASAKKNKNEKTQEVK